MNVCHQTSGSWPIAQQHSTTSQPTWILTSKPQISHVLMSLLSDILHSSAAHGSICCVVIHVNTIFPDNWTPKSEVTDFGPHPLLLWNLLSPEFIPTITIIIIILSSELQYHVAWYTDTNISKIYTVSIVKADVPFCILAPCSLDDGYNILEQSAALLPFRRSSELLIQIHHPKQLWPSTNHNGGRDSSVGIATRYGLEGLGDRILVGARFSVPIQTGPEAHPAPVQWVPGVTRGWSGQDVALTTHPHLEPRLKEE